MMHVPEQYRVTQGKLATDKDAGNNGAFVIPAPIIRGRDLITIASDGKDWEQCGLPLPVWEHVSVHAALGHAALNPTWNEMLYIKNLFWDSDDCVIQFHPPESVYVNVHPNTLHLWRIIGMDLPMPPLDTI